MTNSYKEDIKTIVATFDGTLSKKEFAKGLQALTNLVSDSDLSTEIQDEAHSGDVNQAAPTPDYSDNNTKFVNEAKAGTTVNGDTSITPATIQDNQPVSNDLLSHDQLVDLQLIKELFAKADNTISDALENPTELTLIKSRHLIVDLEEQYDDLKHKLKEADSYNDLMQGYMGMLKRHILWAREALSYIKVIDSKAESSPTAKESNPRSDDELTKDEVHNDTVVQDDNHLAKQDYVARRRLSGAELVSRTGQPATYLKEAIIRKLGLKNGSIVEGHFKNGGFIIDRVKGVDPNHEDEDPTEVFTMGIVEATSNGELIVEKNIAGDPLIYGNQPYIYKINTSAIPSNLKFGVGDIVDLAWYRHDWSDNDDGIKIRWTYQTNQPFSTQTVEQKKLEAKPEVNKSEAKQEKTNSSNDEAAEAAFNLQGKTVAVMVGNKQNHIIFERVVRQHGGKPKTIDAFIPNKGKLKQKLKGVDYVVLVIAYTKHSVSWSTNDLTKQFDIPFAVSQSFSVKSFERALSRAYNGQRAYEPAGFPQSTGEN